MLHLHLCRFHYYCSHKLLFKLWKKLSPGQKQSFVYMQRKTSELDYVELLFSSFFLYVFVKVSTTKIYYCWKKKAETVHTSQNKRLMFTPEDGICWCFLMLMSRRLQRTSLSHNQLVPPNTPQFLMSWGW